MKLDTLSLVPNSFTFFSIKKKINADAIRINYANSCLIGLPKFDSVLVRYRVMEKDFSKPMVLYEKGKQDEYSVSKFFNIVKPKSDPLFDESLVKEGSLSRGFTLGTNNDLGLNSRLNLQISGKLNASTQIVGVISDENIPIQADGTTQRLQEFDRIYLKIFSKTYSLSVGDIVMEKPTGLFLNPNKKLKGLDYAYQDSSKQGLQQFRATVGVAKGIYTRYQIQAQEGVQGPYLLRGSAGEKYIIILSGSEHIYVNGKLMQRGEDKDYVMDYNTAQLTFTPNCMMTNEKRIVAEFEFTDLQYVRFAAQVSSEIKAWGRDFYFNYYREQDAQSQTVGFTLNDSIKQLFAASTTNSSQFWIDASQKTAASNTQNLYIKKDTTVGSTQFDSIFVFSNSPAAPLYSVSFTYVGSNKGDYVRGDAAVNGRIYKWVAPQNGTPQGDYVPRILVSAPQQKDIFSFGLKPQKSKDGFWFEAALSRMNYNTFSKSPQVQDFGGAIDANYQHRFKMKDSSFVNLKQTYQFTSNGFVSEGQFRSPEFARDWNLSAAETNGNHLLSIGAEYCKRKYIVESLTLSGLINNSRSSIKLTSTDQIKSGLEWERNSDLVFSKDSLTRSLFLKNNMKLSKAFKKIKLGTNLEQEYKQQIEKQADTLTTNSWRFDALESFMQTTDSLNVVKLSYKIRQDWLPIENKLKIVSLAQDFSFVYKRPKNIFRKTSKFAKTDYMLSLVFRKLDNKNEGSKPPEDHLLGRLEHRLTLWQGLWVSNLQAETGSGLEQKLDFVFVEVPAGQGIYKWTDYNNNGLKEQGEFEIASFKDEAKYIKIFIPTDLFTKTYQSKINLTVRIQPAAVWHGSKGWSKMMSLVSDQLVLKLDQKLPQLVEMNDFIRISSQATTANSLIRNVLQMNKPSAFCSGEYIFQNNESHSNLASGLETSSLQQHSFVLRFNFGASSLKVKTPITVNQTADFGEKSYQSESYSARDFNIHFLNDEIKLSYQISTEASLSANYKYLLKKQSTINELSEQHLLGAEWKYARGKKPLGFKVKASYNKANYNGNETSATAYTMLDGLKIGNNYLWEASFDKTLNKYFQISVLYQARSNETSPVVHWGSIQAKAIF